MLKEIILEENREEYFRSLGINVRLFQRQRVQGVIAFIVLWFALFAGQMYLNGFTSMTLVVFISAPLFGYLGWKNQYIKMLQMYKKRKDKLSFMFPEFLTTFISLLGSQSGGNIIQTLRLTGDYVNEPLKAQLNILVESVTKNADPESAYNAFMSFANFVGTKEASQVMMLIYEMYIHGTDEGALAELEEKIDRLNDNKLDELVIRKSSRLRSLSIPSLMLTTIFIFIWVGVVLVQVLGRSMNGINF
ncbi:hypothetical protein [Bacillus thuringiensis]|uniref:hypothetical protein n=1 Tax=Bacillus thuringiensis TaxID=1428 RepID=UPI000BFCCBD1|nr:hypothetical protein [Bacillus thuringiensis]PGT89975.1 hypothetical protein COD17_09505 [Bacillus thuringiensis]